MANLQRGMVEIELDKKRVLYFDLNAIAELEDALGIQMSEFTEVKLGVKAIRAMLWAGLIHEDESLTIKEVGKLVNFTNLEYVQDKVTEAFAVSEAKN